MCLDTKKPKSWLLIIVAIFYVFSPDSYAEDGLADAERLEAQAKKQFLQRFTEFTKDKNFMGPAVTPDGQKVGAANKNRFNSDDGLPFQSDLTFHDFSYDVREEVNDEQEQTSAGGDKEESAKVRKLYGFVSEHGKFSEAGGSSALERKVYELHDRFSKEEEEKAKNGEIEEKEGERFRSLFKEDIRDIDPNNKQGGENADNETPEEPEKVSRWNIRDEVVNEVAKIGEDSFETLARASKDPEQKENPKGLTHGLMMLKAGQEGLEAFYKSTLANHGQRIVNQGIRSGGLGAKVELSEGVANCQKWGEVASNTIQEREAQKKNPDPEGLKKKLEEVQKKVQQCQQIAAKSFREINPKFESKGDDGEEQLVNKGSDKEEGRQRDLRVQLETLSRAGVTAQEVQSNWSYEDSDNRAKITLSYDENGDPDQEAFLTVQEQIDLYNQELQSASKGMAEVQNMLPQFEIDPQAPLQYQVQAKQRPVWEITKIPDAVQQEEFGIQPPEQAQPPADSYIGLIEQQ